MSRTVKPKSRPAAPAQPSPAAGVFPGKGVPVSASAPGVLVPEKKATVRVKKAAAAPASPQQPADPQTARDKPKKIKMVRDSFTMPENEYKVLGDVKRACLKAGIEVKKSELLRVGMELVRQMDPQKLQGALAALTPLKAGRPKKEK